MPSLFFPTHATEMLEQTLGNVTIAAHTSVGTAQSVGYAVCNNSTFLTTINTGTKALSLGYGLALTSASAVDALKAKNTYSRCLFGVGCVCEAAGTVSSAVTALNISAALAPIALVSSASGTAFYWLGRKVNALGRIGDIPGV